MNKTLRIGLFLLLLIGSSIVAPSIAQTEDKVSEPKQSDSVHQSKSFDGKENLPKDSKQDTKAPPGTAASPPARSSPTSPPVKTARANLENALNSACNMCQALLMGAGVITLVFSVLALRKKQSSGKKLLLTAILMIIVGYMVPGIIDFILFIAAGFGWVPS